MPCNAWHVDIRYYTIIIIYTSQNGLGTVFNHLYSPRMVRHACIYCTRVIVTLTLPTHTFVAAPQVR